MKTQAWGWLAAGVLAAGLNAAYHDGGFDWAHRIADRVEKDSAVVLALASGRAERFLADERLVGHDEATLGGVDAALAQVQAKLADGEVGVARVEAMSARQEAQLARIQAVRARIEARIAARKVQCRVAPTMAPAAFVQVAVPRVCPRVRVNIPRIPRISVPAPVVHIETPGAGPV
jgi:hypothetical protein